MPLACADTRRQVTAPQAPDLTQRDALARFAPDRAARRALWRPYSHAARPDLLPWDLGLDWSVPAPDRGEVLGEALCAQHLTRVDLRFTVAPTRAQALHLMTQVGLTVASWARTADVPADWDEVVVYLSEYGGHVGQDKVCLPAAQARREHPGSLCTRFLSPDLPLGAPEGVTDAHWSAVTARPDTGPYGSGHDALLGPLFAIDFVIGGGVRWAVDFNTSLGATGAPVHDLPGGSFTGAVQGWRGWTG